MNLLRYEPKPAVFNRVFFQLNQKVRLKIMVSGFSHFSNYVINRTSFVIKCKYKQLINKAQQLINPHFEILKTPVYLYLIQLKNLFCVLFYSMSITKMFSLHIVLRTFLNLIFVSSMLLTQNFFIARTIKNLNTRMKARFFLIPHRHDKKQPTKANNNLAQ
ncbi:hypothetical protein BpHYR1_026119 [Brachionus plicatilis]|uniref:Transmembrane protein n=1 Tax=Brachionus plicatilis TaxID=10195 RepID=A0A3M7T755_BRAPC|nr:hypothetical protein BpHYR1_026119 [Brachionus plicatilis]